MRRIYKKPDFLVPEGGANNSLLHVFMLMPDTKHVHYVPHCTTELTLTELPVCHYSARQSFMNETYHFFIFIILH